MLNVDHAAVSRAAGLLAAFDAGDRQQWEAVLSSDYAGDDPAAAFRTFCAMTAFADRALDAVAQLSGEDPATVRGNLMAALLSIVDGPADTPGDGDDPPAQGHPS